MRKTFASIGIHAILFLVVLVSIFPFIWTIFASTHSTSQVLNFSYTFVWGDYFMENLRALENAMPVWRNLGNSFIIAISYTALVLLIDSMAGYAFAKFNFPCKNIIFAAFLITMMIPAQVVMVPLYIQFTSMKLVNSLASVVLTGLTGVFGVFLMRQNITAFPDSLIEASRIDGSGEARIFFRIVLPSMRPALTSLGILSFVNQWGNYYVPLILLNSNEKYTLPLSLAILSAPNYDLNYGAIMVGAIITFTPVVLVFLIFQKNFIDGMLTGAVKG